MRYGNLRKAHEAAGSDCPAWEALWPAATAAMVEKFDPIRNLDRFGERPCLLLNGAADPLVPTVSNANLVGALQAAGHYSAPPLDPQQCPPVIPVPRPTIPALRLTPSCVSRWPGGASTFEVHDAASAFAPTTKLELVSYPGVKHEVPKQMVQDTMRWFETHLTRPAGPPDSSL